MITANEARAMMPKVDIYEQIKARAEYGANFAFITLTNAEAKELESNGYTVTFVDAVKQHKVEW